MGRAGGCASARSPRATPPMRCAASTSRSVVRPAEDLARGSYYWHEVIGCAVRGVDGAELGTVKDIYRVGETEVFTVDGGPFGSFDLPAVRAFIRVFAPRRGEIVVDAESLDLRAPALPRAAIPSRPKAPRRRTPRHDAPSPSPTERRRVEVAPDRGSPAATAMTLEIDVLTLFPAMFDGPLAAEHPRPDPGAGPRRRSGSTTCATGAWAAIARSTTRRTAAEPG